MNEIISFFTDTETPFLLLFVILFWYYLRESKAREERNEQKIDKELEQLKDMLGTIKEDQKNMLSIWRILIEKELERREKIEHRAYEYKRSSGGARSSGASTSIKNGSTRKEP